MNDNNRNYASKIVNKEKSFFILGDERIFRSKSPAMFNAMMKKIEFNGKYEPLKVEAEKIGEMVNNLRGPDIIGANVTVPYKEAVIPYLDILSEGGNIIGAVNTIVHKDNQLKGYNTNAIGFMDALSEVNFHVTGKFALVFGTGGAARAVTFILNWLGAGTICVVGRNEKKMDRIVQRIGCESKLLETLQAGTVVEADIVINATSVSSPLESPELAVSVENLRLPNCELIVDLNYGRSQNFWHDLARTNSIQFMDGLSTLANQAKATFSLWTGLQVEPEVFLDAMELTP